MGYMSDLPTIMENHILKRFHKRLRGFMQNMWGFLFSFILSSLFSLSFIIMVIQLSNFSNPFSKKIISCFIFQNYHLKVIVHILSEAGYHIVTSTKLPKKWDLLWAHEFPFIKDFIQSLSNLKQYQKVFKESISIIL